MRILISGSTGLVGSALTQLLRDRDHTVIRLKRSCQNLQEDEIGWQEGKPCHQDAFEGFDAVINLAGESVFGRWTESQKKRILDSRVEGTKQLVSILNSLKNPPRIFVSGSAMGYYGSQGDKWLTEESPNGSGFLASVCRQWEEAAMRMKPGTRVVLLRTSTVLTPKGGALGTMLQPFKLGMGGVIGPGDQYMSWVTLEEMLHIILFSLYKEEIKGPINIGSPNPITNQEFTKTLGKVLNRPTVLSMPAFVARLAFGEMADELLLSSTRMSPQKLQSLGYVFTEPNLEAALAKRIGS